MKVYKISLIVDEEWLQVLQNVTKDIYDGETLQWVSLEELEAKID
jgi:hypothetical protein